MGKIGTVTLLLTFVVGCGSSMGGKPSSTGAGGSKASGAIQYAVLTVTGDEASGITPYQANIEIDYDSNSVPTYKGGTCILRYYDPTGSGTQTPDTTQIGCTAALPSSIDGPSDGGSPFPLPPAVQVEIYLKGNISPPFAVDLTSPSVSDVQVAVYGSHNGWGATFSSHPSSLEAFSLRVDSATVLPPPYVLPWTDYRLEAQASVTTAPSLAAPGTVTVSLALSLSKLADTDGGTDAAGATNGTCADLLTCCGAIGDATTASTCSGLATQYQNMVGNGLSQQQADVDCDTFLHLERTAGLCP